MIASRLSGQIQVGMSLSLRSKLDREVVVDQRRSRSFPAFPY